MNGAVEVRELLLAGVPKTGKTSFLTLLYTAIVQGRTADLVLGNYQDDREYLNRVSKRLWKCEEAVHTEVSEQGELKLSLQIGNQGEPSILRIPDLSGETWDQALAERSWSAGLDGAIRRAAGVLLFVHVNEFDSAPSIHTAQRAAAALGESGTMEESPDRPASSRPTQVQVVDMLQLLCEERASRPSRVSIILSAWDLTDQSHTPSEWVSVNAPLVDQYVTVNSGWLKSAIWGVSAQGGSFGDPQSRESLLALDPIERALVVDTSGTKRTVDAPVLWTMGEEQ